MKDLVPGLLLVSVQDKPLGGCSVMRKLLTMVSTLAVAAALSVPAFAARPQTAKKSTETAPATKVQSKSKGKAHAKHSRKKNTAASKKTGKQGTSTSSGK
jgi:hypothetical protein